MQTPESELQKMRSLLVCLVAVFCTSVVRGQNESDFLRQMQLRAIETENADWGHWGRYVNKYIDWSNHSNRLVPIYVFGTDLSQYSGEQSVYRRRADLENLYGHLPLETLNPSAEYFDQTDVYRIQKNAFAAGKKYVFLVVFDGMDYETTRVASIYRNRKVLYSQGRGTGLSFLDYRGVETDYGFFVCSAHNSGTEFDVDRQVVTRVGGDKQGGFSPEFGGSTPWDRVVDATYLMGNLKTLPHVVTDSAASATSMTAGIKTYNGAINVDPEGNHVVPLARQLQDEGYAVGAVTSVPISHATPAAAYANNVTRNDYQDISRDLIGLKSSSHRSEPLSGLDVLIGCGWGKMADDDREKQGVNFVPGNRFLADADLEKIKLENGGKYLVVQRTPGKSGGELLEVAAMEAAKNKHRLMGFFGFADNAHLPYQTADGNFNPTRGLDEIDVYTQADIDENPTLAQMTTAAIQTLHAKSDKGFWLMVEPGDVDWASHQNNIDNGIGAVFSGDAAFDAITRWVEENDAWEDSVVILTADHGHYFDLRRPEAFTGSGQVVSEKETNSEQVKDSSK